MRDRAVLAACAAAAVGLGLLVAPSASSADATASAPAAVTNLAPFQHRSTVTLRWSNPRDIDRDVVRIVRGPDAPSRHTGHAVALGSARATSAVLRSLPAGRQFSVSVWTQRGSALSRRVATSFTTRSVGRRRTSSLAGQVFDTGGHPLRNAIVVAVNFETFGSYIHTRTDPTGQFRMVVTPGRYEIAAIGARAVGGSSDNTGYLYGTRFANVRPGNVRTGLRFALPRAAAVAGVVTDAHGNPLAGVHVNPNGVPAYLDTGFSFAFGGTEPYADAPTNRSGHYLVKGLEPGAVVPCFDAAGVGYASRCASGSVAAQVGQVARAPAARLVPGASVKSGAVRGTVTDTHSHPVRNAVVLVAVSPGAGVEVATDRHGHFAVGGVDPGRSRVCAFAPGSDPGGNGPSACRTVTVVADRTAVVALQLPAVGALSGLVRGPSGRRLGSVLVYAIHHTHNESSYFYGTANQDGAWTITGLAPGVYTTCIDGVGASSAADPTGGRSVCLHRRFRVVAGADRIGADRTLAPAGAIAGTVQDESGKPMANAGVVLSRGSSGALNPATATSDRNGHYRITGLTPGSYRVCAEIDYSSGTVSRHCLPQRVTVVARKVARGDVTTPAISKLTVTVTDSAGHVLSGVDVAVLHSCRNGGCSVQPVYSSTTAVTVAASETTGVAGRAVIHGLRPGRYAVCALAYYAASPHGVPATGLADKCASNTFSVTVTRAGVSAAAISLDPGAAVEGIVHDSHGNPVPNVAMHVGSSAAFDYRNPYEFDDPMTPSPRNDIRTDATGHYLIRSIVPGSRTVCGVAPRAAKLKRGCLSGGVSVLASTTTQAPTLVLNPAASNSGAVARFAPLSNRMAPSAPRTIPADQRIPVINSTGWPEFRLLPRSTP